MMQSKIFILPVVFISIVSQAETSLSFKLSTFLLLLGKKRDKCSSDGLGPWLLECNLSFGDQTHKK